MEIGKVLLDNVPFCVSLVLGYAAFYCLLNGAVTLGLTFMFAIYVCTFWLERWNYYRENKHLRKTEQIKLEEMY